MHRCLKNSLRARLLGRVNWLSELPWVMLGLRAASNLDTGVSPSILVTGQQPTLPGQFVLVRADKVQSSLVPKYTGPFRVLRRWKKCFRLQLENRKDTVSVDRLRPFYEDEADHREPVTDVVDTGKSDIIDDHVDDLVVRRSNRTMSPPIRFGDSV